MKDMGPFVTHLMRWHRDYIPAINTRRPHGLRLYRKLKPKLTATVPLDPRPVRWSHILDDEK